MPSPRILMRIPALRHLAEPLTCLMEGMTVETCHGGALAMRTIIQLDGDVLTFATAAGSDEKVREQHTVRLEAQLGVVARRLDGMADIVMRLLGSVYLGVAVVWSFPEWLDMDGWKEFSWWFAVNLGVSVMIGFAGRAGFVRRVVWKALLRLVRPWG